VKGPPYRKAPWGIYKQKTNDDRTCADSIVFAGGTPALPGLSAASSNLRVGFSSESLLQLFFPDRKILESDTALLLDGIQFVLDYVP